LGSGGEAEGLQKKKDNVSMQQLRYLKIHQGSNFIPGGFDYMCFPFVHYSTTPWDQWQSFGQLHGWSGGVVPFHLPFDFPFHQGALALGHFVAWLSFGCLGLFLLLPQRWEEGGLVGGCRVVVDSSSTTLCVPAEDFQLAVAAQQNLFRN
jgi:hypothetical protein